MLVIVSVHDLCVCLCVCVCVCVCVCDTSERACRAAGVRGKARVSEVRGQGGER